jgi:uncharacterized SAM-binding protein YcdF (DUF218 family)
VKRRFAFKLIVTALICGCLMIIGAEFVFFCDILSRSISPEKADVIIVFDGGPERIKAGCKLADSEYAPYLVISPATGKNLDNYKKKYSQRSDIKYLIEDKARTTAENAVYAGKIIAEYKFESVILVTDSYHLPRSCFLLKAVLAGSKVKVSTVGVAENPMNQLDLQSWRGAKIMYNEMVKLWGSAAELLMYKIRGCLPEKNPKELPAIRYIKSLLLFD